MKRVVSILLMLLLCLQVSAGTRRALAVFIGDYPEASGWTHINASNDRELILGMLRSNGFNDRDIIVLSDAQATHSAILEAFGKLASACRNGDMVYIHFSCHGQQITDVSGDEKDGWDEALIPYDALLQYGQDGYRGGKHLIDDEVNACLESLSSAVGKNGLVLMVSDACHSGDNDRDGDGTDEGLVIRGVLDRFEIPGERKMQTESLDAEGWVSISACREYQNNYEVNIDGNRCGRLSYCMSRVFSGGLPVTALVAALEDEYSKLPAPKGHPRQLITYNIPQGMTTRKIR